MIRKMYNYMKNTWNGEHRCLALLASLVVLIILIFATDGSMHFGKVVIALATTTVFLGGIAAMSDTIKHAVIGIMLVLPPMIMEWLSTSLEWNNAHLLLVPNLYSLPFYIFLIYVVSSYVFHSGIVTQDRMLGAICIYLMLGVMWTNAYRVVYQLNEGAFSFGLENSDSVVEPYRELLYFSYVTLTTLGYGETTPISDHARVLAIFEAITGILFVGILIARLSGALNANKNTEN